ncbi:hypothetical protein IWQ61_002680, partial [Dispira simplex]
YDNAIHPDTSVLASNRDEFLERPTARADWWDIPHTHILGPRDLKAGVNGTWIGISKCGHVAFLTNNHEMGSLMTNKKTRGLLVHDFLVDDQMGPVDYLARLLPEGQLYNGFNIVVGDLCPTVFYSGSNHNRNDANEKDGTSALSLEPLPLDQVLGLSNADFGTPQDWPRVQRGVMVMTEILGLGLTQEALIEKLFTMLRDSSPFTPTNLPQTVEEARKPICLPPVQRHQQWYGTSVSTVILVDHNNHVYYSERELVTRDGAPVSEPGRTFEFMIDPEPTTN